ncbi:MAG: hypothetical protein RIR00_1532, partial [Pseudomonadota bacterium]
MSNLRPILDTSANPQLTTTIAGGAAPTDGSLVGATAVSALISASNFSDANAGTTPGIAVTDVDHGSLWYSTDAGAHWTELTGTVSSNSALLLTGDANTYVYFQADAGATGTQNSALSFKAWDGSTGTNGATGVDTT